MSNLAVQNETSALTPAQIDLLKKTIAKGATDDELALFLHQCKKMQLDPLRSGRIHLVKFKDAPAQIIVGIDGYRTAALRTGKHEGSQRGLTYASDGKTIIGGWAEVFRSDWKHPARCEVLLSEFIKPNREVWQKMPGNMIQKCAEVAALRMAFPDELEGTLSDEELPDRDVSNSSLDATASLPSAIAHAAVELGIEPAHNLDEVGAMKIKAGKKLWGKTYGETTTEDLQLALNYLHSRDQETLTEDENEFCFYASLIVQTRQGK